MENDLKKGYSCPKCGSNQVLWIYNYYFCWDCENKMKNVLIKLLDPRAKVPTKAYNSAAFDLFPLQDWWIHSGQQLKIPLGFATEFAPGYVAIIDDRSSTGNSGVCHMAGVIDCDYRGEWMVMLRNLGDKPYHVTPEKAIAQVLFHKIEAPTWLPVDSLVDTSRGDKCLGSSD